MHAELVYIWEKFALDVYGAVHLCRFSETVCFHESIHILCHTLFAQVNFAINFKCPMCVAAVARLTIKTAPKRFNKKKTAETPEMKVTKVTITYNKRDDKPTKAGQTKEFTEAAFDSPTELAYVRRENNCTIEGENLDEDFLFQTLSKWSSNSGSAVSRPAAAAAAAASGSS